MEELLARARRTPGDIKDAEVDRVLEHLITAGRAEDALGVLLELSEIETQSHTSTHTHALVTPAHIMRVLTAAAFQLDLPLADSLISLALQAPASRLNLGVVDTYASVIACARTHPRAHASADVRADVHAVDHIRGLTFCAFMLEFNFNAFTSYFSALQRTHGPEEVRAAVDVIIDTCSQGPAQARTRDSARIWTFDALVCVVKALTAIGSEHATSLFPVLLAAARESPESARERVSVALDVHTSAMVKNGQVSEAAQLLLRECGADAELRPDHACVRITKALAQTDAAQAPDTNEKLDLMVKVFLVALRANAVMPALVERVLARVLACQRLDDAQMLMDRMLSDRHTRAVLRSDRHCNLVIDRFLKAGRAADAEMIFKRMIAADPMRFPHLAPNVKTFNMFILRAARRGDKAEVRRLMTVMSDRGISADAFTVSAVSLLRTPRVMAAGGSHAATTHAQDEADADALLTRIVESKGRLVRSTSATGTTGPFNQIIQSYFRVGNPAKALSVLDAMNSVRVVPGADTVRTLLVGLALSGGPEVHGVPLDQLPVGWGGRKPDEVYARERAAVVAQRRKLGEDVVLDVASSSAHAPASVAQHPSVDGGNIRCGAISQVLHAYRIEQASMGSAKRSQWCPSRIRGQLAAQLSAWELLDSDPTTRATQLAHVRAAVAAAHPVATPVSSLLEDALDPSGSASSAASGDLLSHLPTLLERLDSVGVPVDRVRRSADPITSWACGFVSPARALQLFCTMYSAGMWDSTLWRLQRAQLMLPGLAVVDLRNAYIPSACAFLHVLLTRVHMDWKSQGADAHWFKQDLALLTGASESVLSQACASALQHDSLPPLPCKPTPKALLLNRHDLAAWAADAAAA